MTPKEKAKKLVEQFTFKCYECDYDWNAKQWALIAVDFARDNPLNKNGYNKYLDKVKKEIENYEF